MMNPQKKIVFEKMGDQDFDQLREECLKNGKLFEDPDFPADDSSIQVAPMDVSVVWQRPSSMNSWMFQFITAILIITH